MVLDFGIKNKIYIYIYIYNIKHKKLNCPLHTKKTNNTNKLIQISHHSALTKIQKLQN